MRWVCVRDASGRYCEWVLVCSSGRIVPSRAGSWDKYQQTYVLRLLEFMRSWVWKRSTVRHKTAMDIFEH
jgi:hypothetical protein